MTVRIINADVFEGLASLPDESVHCVVSSPPYFGLRDYGVAGQIGLEPSFADHLAVMVRVFAEVRRVLRKDGTCWVNYGDGYCSTPPGNKKPSASDVDGAYGRKLERQGGHGEDLKAIYGKAKSSGFKPKDLMMMPARLAIALQDDGWWLRSDIIWAKPNPMPESCRDRPTSAHEHIFLLTKASRYFYDADAIRETAVATSLTSMDGGPQKLPNGSNANAGRDYTGKNEASQDRRKVGFNERWDAAEIGRKGNANGFRGGSYVNGEPGPRTAAGNGSNPTLSRNIRNVWTIATAPFPDAHFATFPPELAERCIKAGCPVGGTVLDPFGGSGTTGLVADRLGRDAILIELNPEYAAMAERRLKGDAPMFADVSVDRIKTLENGVLFA